METTYNKAISMPEAVAHFDTIEIQPVYSAHAKRASLSDRYGQMRLPEVVRFSGADMVEVTLDGETLVKAVIRIAYDDTKDIILVIIPQTLTVKTVWYNLSSDQHQTLDKSKFAH